MIKAEVIIDNTAWEKKIKNITKLFNRILKNLPKKYILKNKKTIIFVNTRAQCEVLYKNLFLVYPDLKIGIYHGSLSKNIRMETEKKFKVNDAINLVINDDDDLYR